MTAAEFICKWRNAINYLRLPSVGIHVGWNIIPIDSRVDCLSGKKAWERIYTCVPPWFKTPQIFRQLIDTKNTDYADIVTAETNNGKIEWYRNHGLQEPYFCAFANEDGSFTMLGDGNHRFLDCLYLIHEEGKNFSNDIQNTTLDIIFLTNCRDVILPYNIWPICELLKEETK